MQHLEVKMCYGKGMRNKRKRTKDLFKIKKVISEVENKVSEGLEDKV